MTLATVGAVVGIAAGGLSIANSIGGNSSANSANSATANAANQQAQIAQQQWQFYQSNYQPVVQNLIQQAQSAGSPEQMAAATGRANADVSGSFAKANAQTKQQLNTSGVNPDSPAYQDALATNNLAEGAASGSAQQEAQQNQQQLAYSKALDVADLGAGIPSQSSASLASAANSTNNLSKTAFTQNQQTMTGVGAGLNTLSNNSTVKNWFNSGAGSTPSAISDPAAGNSDPTAAMGLSNPGGGKKGGNVTERGITSDSFARGGGVGHARPMGDTASLAAAHFRAMNQQKIADVQKSIAAATPKTGKPGAVPQMKSNVTPGGTTQDNMNGMAANPVAGIHPTQVAAAPATEGQLMADGGNVYDAEKQNGQWAVKSTLQRHGLNEHHSHHEALKAAMRHKGAITPHMRPLPGIKYAGGGGVGNQGLEEQPDYSNMGQGVPQQAAPQAQGTPPASQQGVLQGPGTETSDSIPAHIDGQEPAALSKGEFVMSAPVVKMTGEEILTAINNAGLAKRGDKPGLDAGEPDQDDQQGPDPGNDGGVPYNDAPMTSNSVPRSAGAEAYAKGGSVRGRAGLEIASCR
jgi:hypothetical protein